MNRARWAFRFAAWLLLVVLLLFPLNDFAQGTNSDCFLRGYLHEFLRPMETSLVLELSTCWEYKTGGFELVGVPEIDMEKQQISLSLVVVPPPPGGFTAQVFSPASGRWELGTLAEGEYSIDFLLIDRVSRISGGGETRLTISADFVQVLPTTVLDIGPEVFHRLPTGTLLVQGHDSSLGSFVTHMNELGAEEVRLPEGLYQVEGEQFHLQTFEVNQDGIAKDDRGQWVPTFSFPLPQNEELVSVFLKQIQDIACQLTLRDKYIRVYTWRGDLLEGCKVDDELAAELSIEPSSTSVRPGERVQFEVGKWECCVFFQRYPVDVQWQIEPESAGGISYDGLLVVDEAAEPGVIINIQAELENGTVLQAKATVYTPEVNPLVGMWEEKSQILCDGGERVPEEPIEEIVFRADGTFAVTWHPFEVYHDYWGTYSYNPKTKEVSLVIDSGNYIPSVTDLDGQVVAESAYLIRLESIFLGNFHPGGDSKGVCGHVIQNF